MEQFLERAAQQVPALVVLVWVVAKFLVSMKDADERRIRYDERRDAALGLTISEMSSECHTVQRDTLETMANLREEMAASRQLNKTILHYLNDKEQQI